MRPFICDRHAAPKAGSIVSQMDELTSGSARALAEAMKASNLVLAGGCIMSVASNPCSGLRRRQITKR